MSILYKLIGRHSTTFKEFRKEMKKRENLEARIDIAYETRTRFSPDYFSYPAVMLVKALWLVLIFGSCEKHRT